MARTAPTMTFEPENGPSCHVGCQAHGETGLPVRWYLPREDVRTDLLTPSDTRTICAYKGIASYLSADGVPDVAWFYPDPLHDALPVKDLLCFWRPAKVYVDGVAQDTSMLGE